METKSKKEEESKFEIKLEPVTIKEFNQKAAAIPLGVAEINLFGPVQTKVDLFKGSPRMLLSGQQITDGAKTTVSLNFKFAKYVDASTSDLQKLVPRDCFVGCHEMIPGLRTDTLPLKSTDLA